MKNLIFRLLLAAPIATVFLLGPFFIAAWLRAKFELQIPMIIILAISLGGTFLSFFTIAGKQMKFVDQEWRRRKGAHLPDSES